MSNTPINQENKTAMLKRLARVEGQLRGIQKLITNDEDCEKVAQQMTAARRALDKVFHEMLACMIEQNVLAQRSNDSDASQNMAEVRHILTKYT